MQDSDYLSSFSKKVEIAPLFICSVDKRGYIYKSHGEMEEIFKKNLDITINSGRIVLSSNPISSFSTLTYRRLFQYIEKVISNNLINHEKLYVYIGEANGKWYEVNLRKDPENKDKILLIWFYISQFEKLHNIILEQLNVYKGLPNKCTAVEGKVKELEEIIYSKNKELDSVIKNEKVKTEFFTDVSHELRTPLNVILGALQLLNFQMDKGSIIDENGKLNEYLSVVRFNALRLLRLVNNIIDVSKLDSGFGDVELKRCNIISFVEEITNSVIPYMENKSIKMTFDTNEEEVFLLIDPCKMERVILNLLSNAIKFTPEGGSVFVNIVADDDINISIRDTGIGISEDKIDVIFERFGKINNNYVQENEGSGIGLSLAKSIIDQHGGYIKVISELNIGSEFIVSLPKSNNQINDDEFDLYEYQIGKVDLELSDICYQK